MKVEVIESTDRADKLVCKCARNDYMHEWIGEKKYEEIMENVAYNENDVELAEQCSDNWPSSGEHMELEARTAGLIRRLVKRGHWGPMEAPQITFSIQGVSRVVMSQITRHRHLSFDVQSMRYVDFSDVEFIEPPALAGLSDFSRESGEVDIDDRETLREEYESRVTEAVEQYEKMVGDGVPKEAARYVLPLGTPVNITVSGNLRSFLHLLTLRDKPDVQPETRQLAQALSTELIDWAPYSTHIYKDAAPFRPSP